MGADPPARDAEEEPTGAPPSPPQVPDLQAKNDALRCSSARAADDHRATVSTPQSTRAAQEREAARARCLVSPLHGRSDEQNGQEEMRQIQGDVYIGPYCAASGRKIHLGLFLSRSYARVPVNIFTGIFAREHIRPHNSPLHGILLHGT